MLKTIPARRPWRPRAHRPRWPIGEGFGCRVRRQILTIMPDIGCAPYAWINRTGNISWGIGGNIADETGWYLEVGIPAPLHQALAAWAQRFDWYSFGGRGPEDWREFPWVSFHREGLQLARQVKYCLGSAFTVIYEKPWEDPSRRALERREIMDSGRLLLRPRPRV